MRGLEARDRTRRIGGEPIRYALSWTIMADIETKLKDSSNNQGHQCKISYVN